MPPDPVPAARGEGTYRLHGADLKPYTSRSAGRLGGHRRQRIYGRLECPSALRALARGGYAKHRVFFTDEDTAVTAGFRPCAVCLPERYRLWKSGADPRTPEGGSGGPR